MLAPLMRLRSWRGAAMRHEGARSFVPACVVVQRGGAGGGGRGFPPLSDAACQSGWGCHHAGGRHFVDLLCLHMVSAGSRLCVRAAEMARSLACWHPCACALGNHLHTLRARIGDVRVANLECCAWNLAEKSTERGL